MLMAIKYMVDFCEERESVIIISVTMRGVYPNTRERVEIMGKTSSGGGASFKLYSSSLRAQIGKTWWGNSRAQLKKKC